MTKPVKYKIGVNLLLSFIPASIIFVLAATLGAVEVPPEPLWMVLGIPMMFYSPIALIVGLILVLWGNAEFKRTYRTAQRYAELNGWHPISRTSWRNRKRNQVALSVTQALEKRTYVLTVETDGDTTTIDEFETPVWALQFGDWLWEQLLETNTTPGVMEVAEKRAQWETTALAVIPPAESSLSAQRERWQMRPEIKVEAPNPSRPAYHKDKLTAGLLAILLGWLGAHKFYLGHTGLGILYIVGSILFLWWLTGIVGIVEGIVYLTKSDEEFQHTYVQERKAMF